MSFNKKIFNEKRYAEAKLLPEDEIRFTKVVQLAGKSKKILDIACGSGELGKMLKTANQNVELYGIDISPTCVQNCLLKGINAQVIDIEDQPLPFDEEFDCITACEIIEHVIDTDEFLKKISGALKKNGIFIVTTPNTASLGRRLLLLLGLNPLMETSITSESAGHVRYFVKSTLISLLRDHGFEIENYTSDLINFNNSGTLSSKFLATLFPALGRTIIIKCRKM